MNSLKLQEILNSPNECTIQLSQIKRSDLILTNQLNNLKNSQLESVKLIKKYNELVKIKFDDNIQSMAEKIDRELRVLEKTVDILEENKKY